MPTHTNPLIARATALATTAHAGQERDDGGGPYIRHPARVSGVMFTTLMQRIPLFLEDYKTGKYSSYDSLVTTNFIAAEQK